MPSINQSIMPHNTSSNSLLGRLSARSSFISPKEIKVTVQLLNDSDTITHEFKRSQPAQDIINYICEVKNIKERDYLGLRYQDHHDKQRYWVDLSRPISNLSKQCSRSDSNSFSLCLRFRYYPAEPSHLRDTASRYQLFVQLQRDLLHGRLYCPQAQSAELAGLILQAQLGDFDPTKHNEGYVSQYKLVLKQTPKIEEKIAECHKAHTGKCTADAELAFLEMASKIDTYGFDPYALKDAKDPTSANTVYLGVSHRGILIYYTNQKLHHIPWDQLAKVDYIGKELRILPNENYVPPVQNGDLNETSSSPTPFEKDKKSRFILKYICLNGHFAKHLWNHILSQQAFFNDSAAILVKPKFSKPRIPLLSRGSTFRFTSQRVLKEIESVDLTSLSDGEKDKLPSANERSFVRYDLPRQDPRPVQPWLNKYHTLPSLQLNNNSIMGNRNLDESRGDTSFAFNKCDVTTTSNTSSYLNSSGTSTMSAPASQTSSPSSSIISPQKTTTSAGMKENVTSFTVHLVKYDRSPSISPVLSNRLNGGISDDDRPLLTSTPIFDKSTNKTTNGIAKYEQNGSIPNGGTQINPEVKKSTSGRVTNALFASFLIGLLLLALLIAIFERSGDSDWVESSPWLSHVRHAYYEPARHITLEKYNKLVARR